MSFIRFNVLPLKLIPLATSAERPASCSAVLMSYSERAALYHEVSAKSAHVGTLISLPITMLPSGKVLSAKIALRSAEPDSLSAPRLTPLTALPLKANAAAPEMTPAKCMPMTSSNAPLFTAVVPSTVLPVNTADASAELRLMPVQTPDTPAAAAAVTVLSSYFH